MTIDEAIALVKIERECVIRADVCDRKCENCDLVQDSNNLIDMYEQLAKWLEELKAYRENSKGYNKEDIELNRNAMYNKALDDFVKFASDMPTVEEEDGTIRPMWLEEMAEQLKEQK